MADRGVYTQAMGRSGDSLASRNDAHMAANVSAPGERRSCSADGIVAGLFSVILALYFGLVPLGQWQADEYDYFGRLRDGVGRAFSARMTWSPRPLSETVYLAYGLLANQLHRPLTGGFLSLLWVGFLACACATALTLDNSERRLPVLLTGLGLAAAFVTSGPLFQVFYWPAGSAAYLTTLAATLPLFLQVLHRGPSSGGGPWLCGLCLLFAALSSEMGAMLALCFTGLEAVSLLMGRGLRGRSITWWLVPGVAAVAVLVWAATHRLPVSESAFSVSSAALHNPLQSATAAGGRLVLEIVGWSSGVRHAWSVVANLISRLALAVGIALLCPNHRAQSQTAGSLRRLMVLCAALLAACFASLFASYLHFGGPGGERYETLRRCWIVMAYAAAITVFGASRLQRWQPRMARCFAPALLLLGVLLPWHLSPLVHEYAAYNEVRRATEQTFQSGYQQGKEMVFVNPPVGGVITPATLAPGKYTPDSQASEFNYAGYILRYFGKQKLIVSPSTP